MLQKCNENSLEKEAKKEVKITHKDLMVSCYKKQWNNFVSKPCYTTFYTITFLVIIIFCAFLFNWYNKYCISLWIDAKEVTKDLEQRISNFITLIGASLTIAVMLINNIKEVVSKKKEFYKIIFEKIQLAMTVIVLLVCVVFLLIFSFFKYWLIEKQPILFYTLYGFIYFLIPFAIILIVKLFLIIKDLFDPSFIREGLREELKAKTNETLLELKIKDKKLELFRQNWKKSTQRKPIDEKSRFYIKIENYIYGNGDICTKSLQKVIEKAIKNNENIFIRNPFAHSERDNTQKDFDIEKALSEIKLGIKNKKKKKNETTIEELLELLGEELDLLIEEGLKKSDKKWNEKAKKALFETYDVVIGIYLKHLENNTSLDFQQKEYEIIHPIFEQIRTGIIKCKGKSFEITKDLLDYLAKNCFLSLNNVEGKYEIKESVHPYMELDNSKSIPSYKIIEYYLNIYDILDDEGMIYWTGILANISNRIWGNYHSYDKNAWKIFVELNYNNWYSFLFKIVGANNLDLFNLCYDKFNNLSRNNDTLYQYQENNYTFIKEYNETNLPEYLYCKSNFQLFSLICSKYILSDKDKNLQNQYLKMLEKIELRNYADINRLLILDDLIEQNKKSGAFEKKNYMNSDVYCDAYVIDYYRNGYYWVSENFDDLPANIISNDVICRIEKACNYIGDNFENLKEILKATEQRQSFLHPYNRLKFKNDRFLDKKNSEIVFSNESLEKYKEKLEQEWIRISKILGSKYSIKYGNGDSDYQEIILFNDYYKKSEIDEFSPVTCVNNHFYQEIDKLLHELHKRESSNISIENAVINLKKQGYDLLSVITKGYPLSFLQKNPEISIIENKFFIDYQIVCNSLKAFELEFFKNDTLSKSVINLDIQELDDEQIQAFVQVKAAELDGFSDEEKVIRTKSYLHIKINLRAKFSIIDGDAYLVIV